MPTVPHPGSRLSGAGHSPCADGREPVDPGNAGGQAPPRATPPATPPLTPTEAYAYGRQLQRLTELDGGSDLMRYVRLVRPFPIKALSDALYGVISTATLLQHLLTNTQIGQPTTADQWCEVIDHMQTTLWDLSERCKWADDKLNLLHDTADVYEARGHSAVLAIMDSLRDGGGLAMAGDPDLPVVAGDDHAADLVAEEPPPLDHEPIFQEPADCRDCGGHGGSVSDGQCVRCQGSGIDPDDPASPL